MSKSDLSTSEYGNEKTTDVLDDHFALGLCSGHIRGGRRLAVEQDRNESLRFVHEHVADVSNAAGVLSVLRLFCR